MVETVVNFYGINYYCLNHVNLTNTGKNQFYVYIIFSIEKLYLRRREKYTLQRRNLLRVFLLSIFTFAFGWIIKRESDNTIMQRSSSREFTRESESDTSEIKLLTEQLADIVTVNVKNYFYVGESDWTNAINRAIEFIKMIVDAPTGNKPLLFFPYNPDSYKTTSTIVIPHGVNILMESPILYMGTDGADILRVGKAKTHAYSENYKLQVIRNIKTWNSECSGIVIYNSNQSNIEIVQTVGSKYGCTLFGDTKGFAYNFITLQLLNDNQTHLRLKGLNGGWVNENVFLNGRFANTSFNKTRARIAVLMESEGRINANVFYKPSFEIGSFADSGVETIPIIINPGRDNRFYDCRSEGNGTILARLLGISFNNSFSLTYANSGMVIDDRGDPLMGNYLATNTLQEVTRTIYDSGFLSTKSYISKSGTPSEYKIGDLFSIPVSSKMGKEDFKPFLSSSTTIEINEKYINVDDSRGLGRIVTSSVCKDFKVYVELFNQNEPIRAYIIPYDIVGNQLMHTDETGEEYVKAYGCYKVGEFRGSYYLSNLDKKGRVFRVGSKVNSFAIVFVRNSTGMKISSVKIEQILNTSKTYNDSVESSYSPFDWMNNGIFVEGIPKSGKWEKGQILTERYPVIGGYSSYVVLMGGDFITKIPTFGKIGKIE